MNIDMPLPSQLPALRNLWQEAFGDSEEFLNTFFRTAFCVHRCRCVTVNGKLAAALYWFDCLHQNRHIAYLYAVATENAYRGQGICHTLMENTHHHLTKLGYAGTILVPGSNTLFRFYERMGYQICSHIQTLSCTSATEQIPLFRLNKSEYASLRRQFLPEGGVVQENENLDFLQTQAVFYTGPGFLLAAHTMEHTLYGVELLGDLAAAPQITCALGYTKGTFRTPGTDIPFSMYYPLGTSHLSFPTYFGLAFD